MFCILLRIAFAEFVLVSFCCGFFLKFSQHFFLHSSVSIYSSFENCIRFHTLLSTQKKKKHKHKQCNTVHAKAHSIPSIDTFGATFYIIKRIFNP